MKFIVHRYQLDMAAPLKIREGALLEAVDEEGRKGWGDIAPLPGRSRETLEMALEQAKRLPHVEEELYPSVSFALESALTPLAKLPPLPVSVLLMGTPEEILRQADSLYKEGYTSAKVKVSSLSLEDTIKVAQELKNRFHLRIDVNRSWNLRDALTFCSHFDEASFDYIEEPLNDFAKLPSFPLPFALDESLMEYPYTNFPLLKTLVLKPTMMGGYTLCKKWLEWGKQIVLSSSFESGVGITHIAQLAHRLGINTALGIDTYRYLKNDLLATALHFNQGHVWINGLSLR